MGAMALEDLVYFLADGPAAPLPILGWVVSLPGADVIVGTTVESLTGLSQTISERQGDQQVGFLRVPQSAVSTQSPLEWEGLKPKDVPPLKVCQAAWKRAEKGSVELESSGAEAPHPSRVPKGKKDLKGDLRSLQKLFAADSGEEEEDETDDDDDFPARKGRKAGHLPPGFKAKVRAPKGRSHEEDDEDEGLDIKKFIKKGLAAGQAPADLMPLMMMNMILEKKDGKKKRRDRGDKREVSILGGSDSEDSDSGGEYLGKGMKAVTTLHRLHESIRRRPRRIIEQFEQEVLKELGVVQGQPWTLRDWVRKQSWGKFKGIQRCAVQDVEVYELIRNNEHQAAAAQVIQNLKSKVQCVLQGGEWQTAWLLTGLQDPLTRKEFGGSREEMAIVSSYIKALHDLKKKVRENQAANTGGDDDDGDGQAASSRK